MKTLKEIIDVLKIIGISIAGTTFIVFMIKIAVEPEEKQKYFKLTKHLLIATILITISLSLVDIPKQYYGSTVEIVDNEKTETTIGELKDKDCQNRETVNVDGKWYVVTDTGMKISANGEDKKFSEVIKSTATEIHPYEKYTIANCDVLKLFSECQGTFKGFFASNQYFRDGDGLIFPASYTYKQYIDYKALMGKQE